MGNFVFQLYFLQYFPKYFLCFPFPINVSIVKNPPKAKNQFLHPIRNPVMVSFPPVGSCVWKRSVVSDSLQPHGLYSPWNSPGQNTGVGSRSLLQGIFPTQGSNPGLLHCRELFNPWATREARGMLSKSLIQFSVDDCVPSLLFDLRAKLWWR